MKRKHVDWRLGLLPLSILAFVLAAPVASAQDDDWWFDEGDQMEEGFYGEEEGDSEYQTSGYQDDQEWWEDDQYDAEDAGYQEDEFGVYDTDFDWDTDEGWFADWF